MVLHFDCPDDARFPGKLRLYLIPNLSQNKKDIKCFQVTMFKSPPKVDLSKLDPKNPEEMLQMSKKGRSLMMFATVAGEYVIRDIHSIDLLHFSDLILKLQWNLCNPTPKFSDIL
jgi:hypothetical protein